MLHFDCIRLAYPVRMLEKIIEAKSAAGSDLFVMYDIACSLVHHLHVNLLDALVNSYC